MDTTPKFETRLDKVAKQVAHLLKSLNQKCVFAESCTGGKMAAAMTTVPGVSSNFCGSAVTYRESVKQEWLSIHPSDLKEHTAESGFITVELANSVLAKTSEADISVAITGHLGPGVDAQIDGLVFVSVTQRSDTENSTSATTHRLTGINRNERQAEAACVALEQLTSFLQTQ